MGNFLFLPVFTENQLICICELSARAFKTADGLPFTLKDASSLDMWFSFQGMGVVCAAEGKKERPGTLSRDMLYGLLLTLRELEKWNGSICDYQSQENTQPRALGG